MSNRNILLFTSLFAIIIATFLLTGNEKEVDYSTQIKPILNKHCISCHGGVKKNEGFSVLFEEEAFAVTESGHPAIIPGDPDGSELIKRLTSNDPELRMPYEKEPLSQEEIDMLREWIAQGAKWGKHWAYQKIKQPKEIETKLAAGISSGEKLELANNIDFYISRKLEEQELGFSPEENPFKLLRRASLDLTGLPPTQKIIEDFSSGKITYEEAVDQMLAEPTFGEKWASWWLDLARYADTKGYERDVTRTMWPYRDWVIRAFNSDKPFDGI